MRVDNHVRRDAFDRKRQVLLSVGHSNGTLLSVTTSELVTNLRRLDGPHLYLHEPLVVVVGGQDDRVNVAFLGVLERRGPVFVGFGVLLLLPSCFLEYFKLGHGRSLSDNDVVATDLDARANDPINIQLFVRAMLASTGLHPVRNAELLPELFLVLVGTVED